ncbi:MAG TPA: hypothetical protein VJ991_01295 [Balneolales bacterium]|nr:hypothetical protein [Balneolales bacterium]
MSIFHAIKKVNLDLFSNSKELKTPQNYLVSYWGNGKWTEATEKTRIPVNPTANTKNVIKFNTATTN